MFLLNGVQFSLYKKECLAWMVTFAKNTWSERWNQIDLNSDTPTCTRMSHTCLYLQCVSCTWRSTMFRLRICTSARKNLCSIATTYTTWHWHRPNRPTTVDCEKNKTSLKTNTIKQNQLIYSFSSFWHWIRRMFVIDTGQAIHATWIVQHRI